jgi:hypothetical protein
MWTEAWQPVGFYYASVFILVSPLRGFHSSGLLSQRLRAGLNNAAPLALGFRALCSPFFARNEDVKRHSLMAIGFPPFGRDKNQNEEKKGREKSPARVTE